jgi:hypothetical protein
VPVSIEDGEVIADVFIDGKGPFPMMSIGAVWEGAMGQRMLGMEERRSRWEETPPRRGTSSSKKLKRILPVDSTMITPTLANIINTKPPAGLDGTRFDLGFPGAPKCMR